MMSAGKQLHHKKEEISIYKSIHYTERPSIKNNDWELMVQKKYTRIWLL